MIDNEDALVWQHRTEKGIGTGTVCRDDDLVRVLNEITPGFNLAEMARRGEAIRIKNNGYVLTDKGYKGFVQEAKKQAKDDLAGVLADKEKCYYFLPARG